MWSDHRKSGSTHDSWQRNCIMHGFVNYSTGLAAEFAYSVPFVLNLLLVQQSKCQRTIPAGVWGWEMRLVRERFIPLKLVSWHGDSDDTNTTFVTMTIILSRLVTAWLTRMRFSEWNCANRTRQKRNQILFVEWNVWYTQATLFVDDKSSSHLG